MKLDEGSVSELKQLLLGLIILNIAIFITKYVPILFYDSVSMKAGAFHSLADVFYLIVVLFGAYFAYLPKDKSHPHGHERMRPFLSLIIAGSIFMTGVFVVREAVGKLLYGFDYSFTPFFVLALFFSISAKLLASRFMERKSKELDSGVANSISKDYKVDVWASISALIGVLGARTGFIWMDTIFGLFVSGWIFKTSYDVGKKNFDFLTGAAPSEKVKSDIKKVLEEENVKGVLDLEAHYVGPKLHVYCEVSLPGSIVLKEAHKKEEDIKNAVEYLEKVDTAYIHLEPEEN